MTVRGGSPFVTLKKQQLTWCALRISRLSGNKYLHFSKLMVSDRKGPHLPGYRPHPLKGDLKGLWSVNVRANWRMMFRFDENDAGDIELIAYH